METDNQDTPLDFKDIAIFSPTSNKDHWELALGGVINFALHRNISAEFSDQVLCERLVALIKKGVQLEKLEEVQINLKPEVIPKIHNSHPLQLRINDLIFSLTKGTGNALADKDFVDDIIALLNKSIQNKPQLVPNNLVDNEQYQLQMAGISTAAIGYWKEGDSIHPDYKTPALLDVARLYKKYDELYKEKVAAMLNPAK